MIHVLSISLAINYIPRPYRNIPLPYPYHNQFHTLLYVLVNYTPLMGTSTTNKLLVRLPQNLSRRKQPQPEVPKGCLAVRVGEAGGDQQKFVVPVIWFNHPLFVQLLKQAEDEYGFEQKGTITIPCNVQHFRTIIGLIIHHHHHQNQNQNYGCFRVWAG